MAFDGSAWNESKPDNGDLANQIDDYMRDSKSGVSARMAQEHVWPVSQTGTSEAGFHKFITFSGQTGAPSLVYGTNTQLAAIWCSSGSKNIIFTDSAGTNTVIYQSGGGIPVLGGTAGIGTIPYITSGGVLTGITASTLNTVFVSGGTTAAPTYKTLASLLVVSSGQAAHGATVGLPSGVNSNEVQAIMVSIGSAPRGYAGAASVGDYTQTCSVDASRVVTCKVQFYDNGGSVSSTGLGTANFVIIGIVTH